MLLVPVVGVIVVVPVQQGVVEPHFQALGPDGVHVLPHQVAAALGVGGLEIRVLAVEQAEALVVLGGEHQPFIPADFTASTHWSQSSFVGLKMDSGSLPVPHSSPV